MKATARLAIPFLPIGIAASWLLAPILNIDSAIVAAAYLNDFVIPHFAPLYPLFVRSIAVAVGWVLGGGEGHGLLAPGYSAATLTTILIVQHVAVIVAAAYAASRFRIGLAGQYAVVAVLYLNPITLINVHAVLTESLAAVFLIAAFGAAVPILLYGDSSYRRIAHFCLMILLATLTRQISLAFAVLLPFGLALRAAGAWLASDRARLSAAARETAAAAGGLVAVGLASYLIGVLVMERLGIEPRSAYGRAFVYRLVGGAVDVRRVDMTAEQHRAVISRLKSKTDDPRLQDAIDLVASSGYSWVTAFNKVRVAVEQDCRECASGAGTAVWKEVDLRLNRIAMLALLNPDWSMTRDAALRTMQLLGWRRYDHHGPTVAERFDGVAMAGSYRWRPVELLRPYNLFSAALPVAAALASAAAFIFVPHARIMIASLLAAIAAYAALTASVTTYVLRYGLPELSPSMLK